MMNGSPAAPTSVESMFAESGEMTARVSPLGCVGRYLGL